MDAQLQRFIDSAQTLSDVRNIAPSNPVVLRLEHPVTAILYEVIVSSVEPSFMGIPIHAIWVNLNNTDAYFKKALKLMSANAPVAGNGIAGYNQTWIEIATYAEIFTDPQYYSNAIGGSVGPQGPQGPQGPAGPQGDTPVVDYDYIVQQVLAQLP